MNLKHTSCILCGSAETHFRFLSHEREFYECRVCDLLFVPSRYHLSPEEEKQRYTHHHNSYEDAGYRAFLCKMMDALKPFLTVDMKGLDYGCGTSDAMARIFADDGFLIDRYDPYFAPTPLQQENYDFITCTEVVEHFRNPLDDLRKIRALMKSRGHLGIMTHLRDAHRTDADWWYLRDRTHLCFYSAQTFKWIARTLDLKIDHLDQSLVVMSEANEVDSVESK